MNKPALLAGLALLCAALVGYLRYGPGTMPPGQAAPSSDSQAATERDVRRSPPGLPDFTRDLTPRTPPDPSPDASHPLATYKHAAASHPAGVDPMIVFALESFSDEQIAAYNELHVIPFNPAIGKLCQTTPDAQFPDKSMERTRCETRRERPPHPYTQLPDEELEALAVSDPAAALIMGARIVGDDAARNRWYLRAAALSGKSGPILTLANRRYSSAQTYKRNAEGKLALVDDAEGILYRAVLETIAERMGDPRANPGYWRALLPGDVDGTAIEAAVESEAVEIMKQMAQIQRDITGSTQMWELINA